MDETQAERISRLIEPLRVPPGAAVELGRDLDPGSTAPFELGRRRRRVLVHGIEMLAHYQSRLAAQDTYRRAGGAPGAGRRRARTARSATS